VNQQSISDVKTVLDRISSVEGWTVMITLHPNKLWLGPVGTGLADKWPPVWREPRAADDTMGGWDSL